MIGDKLKYICRLYRILKSVEASLIGPGEDPAQPLNEAMAISERFLEYGLTILFPFFF